MNYLTDAEILAVNLSKLDKLTPFAISGVSNSQLSIARYYGGCTYQGRGYMYVPLSDELIRDDVVKFLAKYRKEQKKIKDCCGIGVLGLPF